MSEKNTAFTTYLKLLIQLCDGDLDRLEADDIRDAMDDPWHDMTNTERHVTAQVSNTIASRNWMDRE